MWLSHIILKKSPTGLQLAGQWKNRSSAPQAKVLSRENVWSYQDVPECEPSKKATVTVW